MLFLYKCCPIRFCFSNVLAQISLLYYFLCFFIYFPTITNSYFMTLNETISFHEFCNMIPTLKNFTDKKVYILFSIYNFIRYTIRYNFIFIRYVISFQFIIRYSKYLIYLIAYLSVSEKSSTLSYSKRALNSLSGNTSDLLSFILYRLNTQSN